MMAIIIIMAEIVFILLGWQYQMRKTHMVCNIQHHQQLILYKFRIFLKLFLISKHCPNHTLNQSHIRLQFKTLLSEFYGNTQTNKHTHCEHKHISFFYHIHDNIQYILNLYLSEVCRRFIISKELYKITLEYIKLYRFSNY